ncbi:Golgin candidate 4, partial [Cucurbita argyrosperma subsp. sororia]
MNYPYSSWDHTPRNIILVSVRRQRQDIYLEILYLPVGTRKICKCVRENVQFVVACEARGTRRDTTGVNVVSHGHHQHGSGSVVERRSKTANDSIVVKAYCDQITGDVLPREITAKRFWILWSVCFGFSEDDKQRIGAASQGPSKGVVRGDFFGPPWTPGGSFADLWVDFLLKETEEREKREAEASLRLQKKPQLSSPKVDATGPNGSTSDSSSRTPFPSHLQSTNRPFGGGDIRLSRHHSDSEFSTVPLTSSENTHNSRPLPKY